MLSGYAHSLPGKPPSEWQPLHQHLQNVADLAADFAGRFHSSEWARMAGWLHDAGKCSRDFQDYLLVANDMDANMETVPGRVDHSTAGAQFAVRSLPILGHLLAYSIAGHHSGLLNGRDTGACQESRLKKAVSSWEWCSRSLSALHELKPPPILQHALAKRDAFSVAFFTRMIFSCLVDADFLDTELFMNPGQASQRKSWPADILERMDRAVSEFVGRFGGMDDPVNRQRRLVREACLKAADEPQGLFSLTVPTGGGKTLASLAFALRHALRRQMERVIYVIPLTSIIEQNAKVFREALRTISADLGCDMVLEHHSNLDPERETATSRLAAENWDAPLVVTTSVQFYESLFASKAARVRKLHRLARSVIILDEAQTLPVDYLKPCLRALQELVGNYGATIVVCTATQPAIDKREGFEIGLNKPREIIPDPVGLYKAFQRVKIEDIGTQSDDELCKRLMAEPKVLCIVNTKSHARKLFEDIGVGPGHFHLSGNMCPAHRSEKLEQLRRCLLEGERCRVVSTQVIEAGVDVDFPVVYRSLAGLDSIAQAAGRCNRNGRLPEKGRACIFRSEHRESERFFADTAQCTGQIMASHDNLLDLEAVAHYFRLYYWDQRHRWDQKNILDHFVLHNDRSFPFNFGFKRAAELFQLIDEAGYRPVIIPWGDEGKRLCEELQRGLVPGMAMRRQLQRFIVQVPRSTWERHIGTDIHLLHDGVAVLVSTEIHYSEDTGLHLEGEGPGYVLA